MTVSDKVSMQQVEAVEPRIPPTTMATTTAAERHGLSLPSLSTLFPKLSRMRSDAQLRQDHPVGAHAPAHRQQNQQNQQHQQQATTLRPSVGDDWVFVNTLGTGTFGRVFLVRHRVRSTQDGPYHAMKVLQKSEVVRLRQVEHINNEREILRNVRHPFIVSLYASFQTPTNLFMCLEYVVGGELFSHLRRAVRFHNDVTRFYAAEILLAIEHLHGLDIVYRDLKPENILLDHEGHIKMTDFGFAKRIEDRTWTLCGTPEYLAPEIIESRGHGKAVDWWALGVLVYEMLSGYPPFYDASHIGIYEKILAGKIKFAAFVEPAAADLIGRLLTPDITRRLGNLRRGARDVKLHPWFLHCEWQALLDRTTPVPIRPLCQHPGDTRNFETYAEPKRAAMVDMLAERQADDVISPFRKDFAAWG